MDKFSKKSANIKFHENPSSESRVVHAETPTDRTDVANSRISQFFERD